MEESTIHHVAETAMTFLQKTFIAISGMNIGLGVLAFFQFIPVIAPSVSVIFVIWIGALTVKGKRKDNRLKDLQIQKEEMQRAIDEGQC